jgi:hypothetical protein
MFSIETFEYSRRAHNLGLINRMSMAKNFSCSSDCVRNVSDSERDSEMSEVLVSS